MLANIYLHYAFDLWADQWRRQSGRGKVIIVRFADDLVVGFQSREDSLQFRQDLKERLARFNLELHAEKTRLIEFGQFAAENRKRRGDGKPETFDFLGFTHICAKTRSGRFAVLRHTIRKKMQRKLAELKQELRQRMLTPSGKWENGCGQYWWGTTGTTACRTTPAGSVHFDTICSATGSGHFAAEVSGTGPRGSA